MKQPHLLTEETPLDEKEAPATVDKPVTGRKPRIIRDGESLSPETSQHCLNAALRFLKNRPRSEHEVRARLRHHGYDSQCIDAAIASLKVKGLVDDLSFARFWVDNRDAFRPRGERMIKMELRQKGVASEIIDQFSFASDETENAYRSARQKARSLPRTDEKSFQRRLGDYLKRRGFGYGVINKVVTQVWDEGETVI